MFAVEIYAAVRRFVFVEGKSRREAARVFGLSRDTISKMCRYSTPPGYMRSKAPEGIVICGHPIIAVGAASADSAAIRAALPGDSHHRRLINDLLCWIGRFTEDDGDLRR
jgi:hypothetical protein